MALSVAVVCLFSLLFRARGGHCPGHYKLPECKDDFCEIQHYQLMNKEEGTCIWRDPAESDPSHKLGPCISSQYADFAIRYIPLPQSTRPHTFRVSGRHGESCEDWVLRSYHPYMFSSPQWRSVTWSIPQSQWNNFSERPEITADWWIFEKVTGMDGFRLRSAYDYSKCLYYQKPLSWWDWFWWTNRFDLFDSRGLPGLALAKCDQAQQNQIWTTFPTVKFDDVEVTKQTVKHPQGFWKRVHSGNTPSLTYTMSKGYSWTDGRRSSSSVQATIGASFAVGPEYMKGTVSAGLGLEWGSMVTSSGRETSTSTCDAPCKAGPGVNAKEIIGWTVYQWWLGASVGRESMTLKTCHFKCIPHIVGEAVGSPKCPLGCCGYDDAYCQTCESSPRCAHASLPTRLPTPGGWQKRVFGATSIAAIDDPWLKWLLGAQVSAIAAIDAPVESMAKNTSLPNMMSSLSAQGSGNATIDASAETMAENMSLPNATSSFSAEASQGGPSQTPPLPQWEPQQPQRGQQQMQTQWR